VSAYAQYGKTMGIPLLYPWANRLAAFDYSDPFIAPMGPLVIISVIGGLIVATISTLFVVPIFYTLLRRKPPSLHSLDARFAAEAAGSHGTGDSHG